MAESDIDRLIDELTALQFGDVVPAPDTLGALPEPEDTVAVPSEDTVPALIEEEDTVPAPPADSVSPPAEPDTSAPPAEIETSAPPAACTPLHSILGDHCAPPADASPATVWPTIPAASPVWANRKNERNFLPVV